ncbi:hypothetical protein M422DRAFT_60072 [Sphaerobolus stellatus SS14]|uniref:CMP/dCMP-type deaminase domain-containing protein n=1 Tax=Sphaerobolus stellatus (strain SS14) TaxID=990650 RepID=A0A0C9UMG2_SPHS4|nr:hypothetical protein M422DRAFT_60072 [Sphaerobolus stellatus SS14]
MANSTVHIDFLRTALDEARKCEPAPTAFCVGCIIVTHWPNLKSPAVVLASGYSRELPGNTHAEANALAKVNQLTEVQIKQLFDSTPVPSREDLLKNADVYTTLEPCSIRTSGLSPCADALIAAKIHRCFVGVNEPPDFVSCEGTRKLKDAGIQVVWVKGLEEECLAVARRSH